MESSSKLADSIKIGPWGGPGGNQHWSFKAKVAITEIIITHGIVVDSISFTSIDENGKFEHSEKFGGGGGKTEKVLLDWPGEYLTSISGTCNIFYGNYVVQSLCVYTNQTKYRPFGYTSGTPFNFPMEDGVIIGFHGRGWPSFGYVGAIGVYVKPFEDLFCGSIQGLLLTTRRSLQRKSYGLVVKQENSGTINQKVLLQGSKSVLDGTSMLSPSKLMALLGPNLVALVEGRSPLEVGPWGGKTGMPFDDRVFSSLEQVNIYVQNEVVRGIEFLYKTKDGNSVKSKRHGTGGGDDDQKIYRVRTILLNWPEEYLTKINGTQKTQYEKAYCIESLCFHTNLNKYGPFGPTDGTPFELSMKDGVIVGFHGCSGGYINAIGVYVKNSADLFGPSSQVNTGMMMSMDTPRELGPWGGNYTAKPWDDGVFLAINQVDVRVKNGILLGIQLRYQTKNGNSVDSERHGDKSGDVLYRIKLDISSEYLSCVMGFYGPVEGSASFEVVPSLSFYTNKGKYGPFGNEIGMFFSAPAYNGKVVGFHVRSGFYLDAIGVHVEHISV
ncbi:hypothetical protein Ddye_007064 [Dipteronia dyeriana]|uniref:Jacalin-type lectin domain-containing protein n=1 Tax=Dipteronia dyeriana TaxID=168575 RepID=A0AAD9XJT6_9ROSI|nr:hypothetical protein Ddye_007064 [Dipteronia dyeriana]